MNETETTARCDGKLDRRFWRPRFSLRTLVILITLVCAYFGAWEVTKGEAEKLNDHFHHIPSLRHAAPFPLLITVDSHGFSGPYAWEMREYYLWLFGPSFTLHETERPVNYN